MRFVALSALLLPLVAACGGGGSEPTLQTAALQGVVYEVDGQTLDRDGVPVRILETGQVATTDANGRFFFASVPAGAVTLDFGTSIVSVAQTGPGGGSGSDDVGPDDNGVDAPGSEVENEAEEDDDDNPIVGGMDDGDTCEVRAAVEDGQVAEISVVSSDRVRSMARLLRDAASPDADVEGKVKIETRDDREKFSIEAEHLTPGTVVEFFLDDPADAAGFVSIGTAAALADGEAELERNTADGDTLPMGAEAAQDLAGFRVEVRLTSGELLLTGEVPDLPDATVTPGTPGEDGRSRGRARLAPHVAGLEGDVEIRQRLERNEQRFEMEAEHLAPGTPVAFWIEDPDALGTFVRIAGRTADAEGEAEIDTNDGLPMPLGATDVADLVGLQVRVTRDDGSDEVLLSGSVPPLVAD